MLPDPGAAGPRAPGGYWTPGLNWKPGLRRLRPPRQTLRRFPGLPARQRPLGPSGPSGRRCPAAGEAAAGGPRSLARRQGNQCGISWLAAGPLPPLPRGARGRRRRSDRTAASARRAAAGTGRVPGTAEPGRGGPERPAPYAMGWVKPGPAAPTVMAARGLRPPRRARAGAGAAVLLPVLLLVLSRGAAQELSPRGRNVCRAGG